MLTSTVNTFEVASASADSYTFNYAIHKATDLKVYIFFVSSTWENDPIEEIPENQKDISEVDIHIWMS